MKQMQMKVNGWGGRRDGAGRKRVHSSGVSHRKRQRVTRHTPVHVNIRYNTRIRNQEFLLILKRAILSAQSKGMRFLHYSVHGNHLHFILEASSQKKFTSAMRSLTVSLAKGLGSEPVQLGRYHLHVLRTPAEVGNAVKYVVFNDLKHSGKKLIKVDSYSSAGRYLRIPHYKSVSELDVPKTWLMQNHLEKGNSEQRAKRTSSPSG